MAKEKYVLVVVTCIVLGIIVFEVKRSLKEVPVTDVGPVAEDRFAGVTSKGLLEKMKNGEDFLLVDLRRPAEFREGHIKGAVNIPVGDIETVYGSLNQDSEIILYCTSGPWSRQAYRLLQDKGFKKIRILVNGIVGWKWEVNGEVVASPSDAS